MVAELELQRKLVNVRLLSKAEAQLVQFSHSSDVDVDADVDVDVDDVASVTSMPMLLSTSEANLAQDLCLLGSGCSTRIFKQNKAGITEHDELSILLILQENSVM